MKKIILSFILSCFISNHMFSVEFDALLDLTGTKFHESLDAIVADSIQIGQLRSNPISSTSGKDLRRELLRKIVLAKVDVPEVFASFDELVSFNRPDSPMYPKGWVQNPGRPPLDEQFMLITQDRWLKHVPVKGKWLGDSDNDDVPDLKRMKNFYWPALVFGLTSEPSRIRYTVTPSFYVFCRDNDVGELELEAFIWFCERTQNHKEVIFEFKNILNHGFLLPGKNKQHLVTCRLKMMESIPDFISPSNKVGVDHYIDTIEKYGSVIHVPRLRKLADNPIWFSYRAEMLRVADILEKGGVVFPPAPTPK